MKKEKTEELSVKWIDKQLSPEEEAQLADLMENDPSLEEELMAMRTLSDSVAKEIAPSVEPPYGDFFNSQLMRKVDLEIESQRPAKKARRWWESLRWGWAPAGALALVLSFFAGHRVARPTEPMVSQSEVNRPVMVTLPTVYFTSDSMEAEVIANADGEVSAIVVNGLTAISDEIDFVTVSTKAQLPGSYESSEARRFQ